MKLAVLHGPNLNLLGQREPELYGRETLTELNERLHREAEALGISLVTFQSNSEGALIDEVQRRAAEVDGFVINAGGYSQTSIALREALVGVNRPFIEVHLSNVMGREEFRRRSMLAERAVGAIMGFGADSYLLGIRGLAAYLQRVK